MEGGVVEPPAVNHDKWRLYEAYNKLHGLAPEFDTPFDVPAVLVVGCQTDSKSALVEALMGFQFNHVGGGTKTRRPITLHMKYDPDCEAPVCHLVSDDDPTVAHHKSLHEIQAFIEAENMRLESEPSQFSAKEIIIRVEYKYFPNLTIIDTLGLIAPAPGRKNRALQSQARAVESLVRAKMQHKEFIILCLEDCSDWSNATTRRVVMQGNYVVSGGIKGVEAVEAKEKSFKARMTVRLAVAGAFHTRFMEPAVSRLEAALKATEIITPRIPVISNVDAQPHSNSDANRRKLVRQWETTVSTLLSKGLKKNYELGPRKVLAGIVKRANKSAEIENIGA